MPSSQIALSGHCQPITSFCQKLQSTKWTDAIILVNLVAALIIGILASAGIFNSMGTVNATHLSMAMYGLAGTWLIIELAKLGAGCVLHKNKTASSDHKVTEDALEEKEDLAKQNPTEIDLQAIDKVFIPLKWPDATLPKEEIEKKERALEELPKVIEAMGTTPRTAAEIQREKLTIKQLNDKYQIIERDGTTWGFDTVLLRGVHLPDATFDTQSLFSSSMTSIINKTFMEGMKGNGYMYNDTGGSDYHDELVIEKRHNWLVSTTFQLAEACVYAAPNVGTTGMIFFVHAPQAAMKKELFGVNLGGGGKKTITDSAEVGFVFVPPEYILGAMPVTNIAYGWSATFQFHTEGFVPNPHAHVTVNDFQDVIDLELEGGIAHNISKKFFSYVHDGYSQFDGGPHHKKANEADSKRLALPT